MKRAVFELRNTEYQENASRLATNCRQRGDTPFHAQQKDARGFKGRAHAFLRASIRSWNAAIAAWRAGDALSRVEPRVAHTNNSEDNSPPDLPKTLGQRLRSILFAQPLTWIVVSVAARA